MIGSSSYDSPSKHTPQYSLISFKSAIGEIRVTINFASSFTVFAPATYPFCFVPCSFDFCFFFCLDWMDSMRAFSRARRLFSSSISFIFRIFFFFASFFAILRGNSSPSPAKSRNPDLLPISVDSCSESTFSRLQSSPLESVLRTTR